jgi:hypothetical protein
LVFELGLVLIASLWIAALVPPWVRSVRDGRPGDSIANFRRQLNVLQRSVPGTSPRPPMTNHPRGPVRLPSTRGGPVRPSKLVQQRRRQVLVTLGGLSVLTAAIAVTAGGRLWALVCLAVVTALGGYVALLVRVRRSAALQSAAWRYRSAA